MTPTRLTIIVVLFALVVWLWKLAGEDDRIKVAPASLSVSYEHYLEERDEEQRRWDEQEGLA